jgi:RNA polymerase sigma-70 factor (ECF subfamily)
VASESPERFEERMLPHLGAAYTLARYLLREPADAEDAVQEAYLQAVRRFETFRGENARAWLLTIVRRTCYAWADRARRYDGDAVLDDLPATDDAPDVALLRSEVRAGVGRAVEQLPLPFREVLVLREIQELSYKEIAEVTGVPIGTVMSRLARARQRLLGALSAEGLGGGA